MHKIARLRERNLRDLTTVKCINDKEQKICLKKMRSNKDGEVVLVSFSMDIMRTI